MAAGSPGALDDGEHGDQGDQGDDGGGLRAALAGLTTRGRSFLAAGVAAAACAQVPAIAQPSMRSMRFAVFIEHSPIGIASMTMAL